MTAIKKQVGGDHYTKMRVQPIELAYQLNATPCFCKVSKYLTRDKGSRLENLEKALHIVEIEESFFNEKKEGLPKSVVWCLDRLNLISFILGYRYLRDVSKYNEQIYQFSLSFDGLHTEVFTALSSMYSFDYTLAKAAINRLIEMEKQQTVGNIEV